ncbi:MAG: T9SS type A sorting domain-containing protein [Bacteroidia bacterium]
MKHLSAILAFFTILICLNAQRPYQPMVVEGATWVVEDRQIFGQFPGPLEWYMFQLEGDTTIVNEQYLKVFRYEANREWQVGEEYYSYTASSKALEGALREDPLNRKVYYRKLSEPSQICGVDEILLYDFALQVQDTLSSCFKSDNLADRVDSIYISPTNSFPKILLPAAVDSLATLSLFPNLNNFSSSKHIEGIGSDHSIFADIGLYNTPWETITYDLALYCRNGTSCGTKLRVVTSIDDKFEEGGISVYPNPTHAGCSLKIDLVKAIAPAAITIHDLSGRAVFTRLNPSIENKSVQIQMPDIPSGIYRLGFLDKSSRRYARLIAIQ